MTDLTHRKSLADILPCQDQYYLLNDGTKHARFGNSEATGLLVFDTLEKAQQFCQTVAVRLPAFRPVSVDAGELLDLIDEMGAICVTDDMNGMGLMNVGIATLSTDQGGQA